MTIYTFKIPGILYLEDITTKLTILNLIPDNLNYSMDILSLIYDIDLPVDKLTQLSSFFASYIPILKLPNKFYNSYSMQLVTNKIDDTFYRLTATSHLIFDELVKSININFIGYGNNYTIRIYNFTTKEVLNEQSFSNITKQINTINISVPKVDSIIEIHIKVNNDTVVIDSAQINLYTDN